MVNPQQDPLDTQSTEFPSDCLGNSTADGTGAPNPRGLASLRKRLSIKTQFNTGSQTSLSPSDSPAQDTQPAPTSSPVSWKARRSMSGGSWAALVHSQSPKEAKYHLKGATLGLVNSGYRPAPPRPTPSRGDTTPESRFPTKDTLRDSLIEVAGGDITEALSPVSGPTLSRANSVRMLESTRSRPGRAGSETGALPYETALSSPTSPNGSTASRPWSFAPSVHSAIDGDTLISPTFGARTPRSPTIPHANLHRGLPSSPRFLKNQAEKEELSE